MEMPCGLVWKHTDDHTFIRGQRWVQNQNPDSTAASTATRLLRSDHRKSLAVKKKDRETERQRDRARQRETERETETDKYIKKNSTQQ